MLQIPHKYVILCISHKTNTVNKSDVILRSKEMNVSTTVLNASIEKNKEVRTDKDWEKQIGRAVSED
jgi:hypothetical protein